MAKETPLQKKNRMEKKLKDHGGFHAKLIDIIENWKPKTGILEKIKKAHPLQLFAHVNITQDMAKDLLTLDKSEGEYRNRRITASLVARLLYAFKNEQFMFTGDPIKISSKMNLLDTQHRLLARALSDVTYPVKFHIQTGLAPDTFSVIDRGKMRTTGDLLSIAGHERENDLAAAVKAVIYFEKFQRIMQSLNQNRVTDQEVLAWSENKRNMQLMKLAMEHTLTKLWKPREVSSFLHMSSWSAIYYLLAKVDRTEAIFFLDKLSSGQGIGDNRHSQIWLLREFLISFNSKVKYDKRRGGSGLEIKFKYVMRAWNLFRAKKVVDRLTIDLNSPKIELPV